MASRLIYMISPTGRNEIRQPDNHGQGYYGAKRGDRKHKGIDLVCSPGQVIFSPITGVVIREAKPYAGMEYSGLLIQGTNIEIKMFYFEPDPRFFGRESTQHVQAGQPVGIAQKISDRYTGMTDHIHLQIESIDPELLLNMP